MGFFEKLKRVDKSAFEKSGLNRLAENLPPSFNPIRTAEGRHGSLLVVAILVAVLATLAVVPTTTDVSTGENASAAGASAGEAAVQAAENAASQAAPTDIASAGTAAQARPLNPQAEIDYVTRIGKLIKPVSTSIPGGNRNTWVGVTDKEIRTAVSLD
ncbi:MAG: hypothetical protein ACRD1T_24140, partial [Acidimicrobiia bacterium]